MVADISRYSITEIEKIIDKASVIAFDNTIIMAMGKDQLLSRNFFVNRSKSKEFYLDVWNLVYRADKPVFLMHASSDLHAVHFGLEKSIYEGMLKKFTGICWPYHQCPMERSDEHDRYPYNTLKPYNLTKAQVIGMWDEITSNINISIDFPHCISQKEFVKRPGRKTWDIIVPGVSYITRQIAQESVVKADLFVSPFVSYSRWLVTAPYYLYNRLLRRNQSTPIYQNKSFRLFRSMISMSSLAFVCGSELRYFVRKFIEIPAFRTAMIAYPTLNFRDYGFEDGVHYLETYPEETGEKAKYLLANKNVAEKMAANAVEMVKELHTAEVRVDQILSCLIFFQKGKLKGAGFSEGKFEIY